MQTIKVDFLKPTGKIKPVNAVNNGPAGSRVRGTSNFDTYKALGIPYARNHDASFYSGYGGKHTVKFVSIFWQTVYRTFPLHVTYLIKITAL